ncbi:hypothetical protein ASG90_16370 [Nocardioides sp. Soil797]|nr:hypothetical protein ASG90_16370 [Nocardioides sp. Soil797]
MLPRPHRRRLRLLATSVLGVAVAAGGVLAVPSQATPGQAVPALTPVAAPPAAPVAAPTPDVLDVTFDGGAPVDHAQNLGPVVTYGAPTFGTDPKVGPTMDVNGTSDAVEFPFAQWGKLSDGFSVECVVRIDGSETIPVGNEKDLCSDKQSGGASIFMNASGLGFMVYVDGVYYKAMSPQQPDTDRWYHVAATWDGQQAKLYVNGQLASAVAAKGTLGAPSATAHRFVIGADPKSSGAEMWAPKGSFASAAVHSTALDADQVAAAAAEWDTALATPEADVLDVDFSDGTSKEKVRDLGVTEFGDPEILTDSALGRKVVEVDGDDAYGYAFTPHWEDITDSFSTECTFIYTGTFPTASEMDICSGKEAGGFATYVSGDQVGTMVHAGGGYKNAKATVTPNQWHHTVSTWDGNELKLYLDGELVATTAAPAPLGLPSETARAWTVGADSGKNATAQFHTQGRIAASRLYSSVLTADQVEALDVAAFGEFPSGNVTITSTNPADGDHLSEPVELEVEVANQENALGWTYLLDDEEVRPGDTIGEGLAAGDHTLTISATDVFGSEIEKVVTFTSDSIPKGGGTGSGQGDGTVSLSAVADSPDGSDVTTTFREATATIADGGRQGVLKTIPTTLDFEGTDEEAIEGKANQDDDELMQSPTSGEIPFQAFDVEVGESVTGQQVVWKGVVDPERSVSLRAWNATKGAWVEIGASRGSGEGETVINGVVRPAMVDAGTVHLLVLGLDPFADDLSPRDESAADDKDSFENPDDYDFSLVHFTDTQYLAEGGAGGTYDDFDGVDEPSDVMHEEERAVWAKAYTDTTKWIQENAAERKIAYAGHTGDIIENDYYNPAATNPEGGLLYPGLEEQVTKEFEFTSDAQSTLDDSGVVNQVIAGNHDNQLGQETGPESRFNQYYGPERYYGASDTWPEGASYHAWDEVTDASGNVVTEGQDNQNNYVLFSAGDMDFVAVGLSYGVTQEEADWASEVFARFPDRNGILLTHAYLAPSTSPDGRDAKFSGDGSKLYDEVVTANPNVFLVLAGHEHGVGTNVKSDIGATVQHNVVELLADYQFYKVSAGELWPDKVDSSGNIDLNGDGVTDHKSSDLLQFGASWMRLLQFDIERAEVSIDTYSPMFDNFGATEYDDRKRYNASEDNLTLPVDLSTRSTTFSTDGLTVVSPTDVVIGEDTAKSGWPATVEWSGLEDGQIYAWTAESRNASGERLGAIRQFGTVFRATAAGTDTTAPTIEMTPSVEVNVGEEFDPLAGVTATDDSDGDVTDQIQVIGEVDVTRAGAFALTYVVSDANGNQTIAPRTVRVVEPVDDRAESSVSASKVDTRFGTPTTLTATVSPASATGQLMFLNGEDVLCEATVTNGKASCDVQTLPPPGDYVIVAAYQGDDALQGSEKSFVLTVGQPGKADPKLSAKAKKKVVAKKQAAVLTAKVASGVTGKIIFKSKGKTLCKATINRKGVATCKTSKKLKAGTWKVTARYAGSATYKSATDTFSFRKRG